MFLLLMLSAISLLFVIILIRSFFCLVTIEGYSMRPTLEPGDRVLVIRHYPRQWLKRGQIIVISRYPKLSSHTNSPGPQYIIKRLVGLPGDSIKTHLFDIPNWMHTDYVVSLFEADGSRSWHVEQGNCFLLGDSPGGDSMIYGPFTLDGLLGLVVFSLSS